LGGLANSLANLVKNRLKCKTRPIEFSLMQRCAAHCVSQTDLDEAYLAGKSAVENAVSGVTDKMVAFEREMTGGKYSCKIKLIDLKDVANTEKKVPREWINEAGNGLNKQFIDYVLPLIQGEASPPRENGVPHFAKLKKVLAKM
ncbi:MAG: 6-phosphofructokinase, partial [Bacillota bacterium]|nr:6-phosphofructokinase [Bacillota bacterium]